MKIIESGLLTAIPPWPGTAMSISMGCYLSVIETHWSVSASSHPTPGPCASCVHPRNAPQHSLNVQDANFWIPTTRIMRMILRPESFPLSVTTDQINLENGVDSAPRISSILRQGSHPKKISQSVENIT